MDTQDPRGAHEQRDHQAAEQAGWRRWKRGLVSVLAALVPAGLPSRAAWVMEPRERRLLGWELLVVLGIFPLASGVVPGLIGLVSGWLSDGTAEGSYYLVSLPDHVALSLPLDLLDQLVDVMPAVLVAYLLTRSGEGLAGIGLDRSRLTSDAGLLFLVMILAYLGPMLAGKGLLEAVGLEQFTLASRTDTVTEPMVYLLVVGAGAVVAGVVEELVVLGYLVHRLEQLGWRASRIVAVAVLVRVSFHVYYGPGLVWVALWAAASVLLYLRVRRLLPFVVVHALWDLQAGTSDFVSDDAHLVLLGVIFIGLYLISTVVIARSNTKAGTDTTTVT
jgi:membrane protease YdiL (CAAX protease family)